MPTLGNPHTPKLLKGCVQRFPFAAIYTVIPGKNHPQRTHTKCQIAKVNLKPLLVILVEQTMFVSIEQNKCLNPDFIDDNTLTSPNVPSLCL